MQTVLLAHAALDGIGVFPLSFVLAGLAALLLATGALGTRSAARSAVPATVGAAAEGGGGATDVPLAAQVEGRAHAPGPGRIIGAVLLAVILLLSAFGPSDPANNQADLFVLLILWAVVALVALLAGDVWHRVDPLAAINSGLARLSGDAAQVDAKPLSATLVDGSAVVGLTLWAWAQMLVDFTVVGWLIALLTYSLVHVLLAGVYGPAWLRRAESLNVLSRTAGLLRPGDGGPLRRLTVLEDQRWIRWSAATLIAWSLLDLIFETEWWHDLGLTSDTTRWLGLLLVVAVVTGFCWLSTAATRTAQLGPALLPVAGAWLVSHYLSVLLIEGQGALIWLSDPLDSGLNLLGRAGEIVDPEPLPVGILVTLQLVPFVLGHLAGVVVAQRRAARRLRSSGPTAPTLETGRVAAATLEVRALIAVSLLGGAYLQLGGL